MTLGYYPPHCTGCRCFQQYIYPSTYTTSVRFDTPHYAPKHRKPGPAQ